VLHQATTQLEDVGGTQFLSSWEKPLYFTKIFVIHQALKNHVIRKESRKSAM
jgi:hypothetical protein